MNAKANASETLARSAAVMATIAQLMTRLEIPAIPRNYSLLHEALTGSNTALGREITALGKAPAQELLDAIGVRNGLPDHNSLVLGHSATDLMKTIEAIAAEAEAERHKKTNALTQIRHLLGRLKADPVMAMSDFAGQADLLVAAVESMIGSESAHCQRLDDVLRSRVVPRRRRAASAEHFDHHSRSRTGLGRDDDRQRSRSQQLPVGLLELCLATPPDPQHVRRRNLGEHQGHTLGHQRD